jgi:hypothetical protein
MVAHLCHSLTLVMLVAVLSVATAVNAQPPVSEGGQETSSRPATRPAERGEGVSLSLSLDPDGLFFAPDAETQPVEQPTPPAPDRPVRWLKDLDLTGFWEIRGGTRTQHDPYEELASLGETRLHLDWEKFWSNFSAHMAGDFLYDQIVTQHSVNLETGQGWFDLRQANVSLRPVNFMDARIGRQVLTWGTGDLLFINDLFPKDWQAFFIRRDIAYLKAPSDAVKVSLYSDLANADVVYTPRFDADRYITGQRLSYFNSALGRQAGRDAVVHAETPNQWFENDEWAARVFKNIRGYEVAAYGHWGRWKSPGGMNPASGKATFPRLSVYGASARGQFLKGIGYVEAGYYDSRDDRGGDKPFVNNSQLRLLGGYEQDLSQISRDLTAGCQYYIEWTTDYDDYLRALPPGSKIADEVRHVLTFRVTKKLLNQNLILGLFTYYSPSDSDAYFRPNIQYKIDDHWTVECGGNVLFGAHDSTFFDQFSRNSNVYVSLRYGF